MSRILFCFLEAVYHVYIIIIASFMAGQLHWYSANVWDMSKIIVVETEFRSYVIIHQYDCAI